MKIVAIGGPPGSGKSTLMTVIMKSLDMEPHFTDVKFVPYHKKNNVYVLGKYENDEIFGGTDKMSMAVQQHAINFLSNLKDTAVVLFEGDRLFNSSFLEYCTEKYNTKIIHLSTLKTVRQERCKSRGSNQNETWLKGRETKISNILSNLLLQEKIENVKNNTVEDQKLVIDFINKLIEE